MDLFCPHCSRRVTVPDGNAGQVTSCPSCAKQFMTPSLAPPPPIAVAQEASSLPPPSSNGSTHEVLTLTEAATYLRLPEPEVVRMVGEQGLPARQVGAEWRFLKSGIQRWLSQPISTSKAQGIWAAGGSWKDDPYLDDMLQEIYRKRGRPMTEEG